MSVIISYNPSSALLSVVENGADKQVLVRVVKNAGQAPFVTVTNDNHVSFSQSVSPLAGVDVRAKNSESITSIAADAYTTVVELSRYDSGGHAQTVSRVDATTVGGPQLTNTATLTATQSNTSTTTQSGSYNANATNQQNVASIQQAGAYGTNSLTVSTSVQSTFD